MGVINGSDYGLPSLDLNFARNKSLNDTVTGRNLVTFTRSSTGTYVGADGLIKTAAVNEPRFDHNPTTGACNGLLIEEGRTNLVGSPTLSYSLTGVILTLETTVLNPIGTYSNIGRMQCTATTDGHGINGGGFVSYSSGAGTNSIFVKKGNHRYVALESRSNLGGGYSTIYFDFDTEQISGGNRGYNVGFIKYPNGWYRIFSTNSYDGNNPTFGFRMLGSMSFVQWTATGNEFVYFWGPQLEAGSFPTSYIPTSGSTVTRTADIASISGTNFSSWYNNNEGTVLFDAALGESTNGTVSIVFANYLWGTSPNIWRTLANTGIMITSSSRTTRTKHAFGLQQNNHSVSINGSISSAFDNNSTSPSSSGPVSFNANGNTLNGYISRLTYYPKRLPNYQLQALTR
jgi:hypothetical protein